MGGGFGNYAPGVAATIGGGEANDASAQFALAAEGRPHPRDRASRPDGPGLQGGIRLGGIDKAIGFQDADGVALAAIQGMHRLVQQKDAQIQALQQRVASMQRQMALVESMQQRIAALEVVHDEVATLKAMLDRGATTPFRPAGLPSRSDSRAAN